MVGEVSLPVLLEVVAGVEVCGHGYCPRLRLCLWGSVVCGGGGFHACFVAVKDVDDVPSFSDESLEDFDVLGGDCGTAGGVDVGVPVVVHCDDIELSFYDVADVGVAGALVCVGDVWVVE